ncbi:MAG: hypothetical protein M3O15_11070 [Acidobacteriota bacterium]|nr:hypothetical protein [Acidobacteriota bacterium]
MADSSSPLTRRALLSILTIREWRAVRRDKEVTAQVARDHGADIGAGRYTKLLLSKSALAAIARVRTEARTFHYQHTLPWCDDGSRILPSAEHLAYMDRMRALRERFETTVSAFLEDYPRAREAARTALGTLYREADYPDTDALRDAFAFSVRLQPVPDGHDWRVELPNEEIERIREELQLQNETTLRTAMADLYQRLAAVVAKMAHSLSNPSQIFRDTLVGNVRQICSLLPSLNVAADPDLQALGEQVERQLGGLDPTVLRENPAARQEAAGRAAELLQSITDRLSSYTGV